MSLLLCLPLLAQFDLLHFHLKDEGSICRYAARHTLMGEGEGKKAGFKREDREGGEGETGE